MTDAMTDVVAFEALVVRCRTAFNAARDEVTEQALAEGKLSGPEICIALAMAGVNITALAIIAGRLDIRDWEGELATAVALKRAGLRDPRRERMQ